MLVVGGWPVKDDEVSTKNNVALRIADVTRLDPQVSADETIQYVTTSFHTIRVFRTRDAYQKQKREECLLRVCYATSCK